jgi:hypothetical protein
MLVKTIKYTDFFGIEQNDEFMFNLSRPEVVRLDVSYPGGIQAHVAKFVAEKDYEKIMKMFEDLITISYGVRSVDGKRFVKDSTVVSEFLDSAAYAALYEELLLNADNAAQFFNGVIPLASNNE